jgi:membrane protein YdbS with pleckstrin-like domain
MLRKASNRRGFSNRTEVLIGITIVGLALSAGLPAFEEALSVGWPSWLAALVFPITFLVLIAYLFGVPYIAFKVFRRLGWVSDEHSLSVGYGVLMAVVWLAGIPILIYFAAEAAKLLLR